MPLLLLPPPLQMQSVKGQKPLQQRQHQLQPPLLLLLPPPLRKNA